MPLGLVFNFRMEQVMRLSKKSRYIAMAFCVPAAIVCYLLSSPVGSVLFFFLGAGFEGFFWLGVLDIKRERKFKK